MSGATNGTTNGKAAAHARSAAAGGEERSPIERMAAWIATQVRRGKIERLELVVRMPHRDETRLVEAYPREELEDADRAAREVWERAEEETRHGGSSATYAIQNVPAGAYLSFTVMTKPIVGAGGANEPATIEGALALAMTGVRNMEASTQKFLAAMFQGALEASEVNRRAFQDREKATSEACDKIAARYEAQNDQLAKMVDRLMSERESYVDHYVTLTTARAADDREARTEERKLKMREDMFAGVVKPMLPMITQRLLAGVARAKDPDAKTDAKPDEKKAEEKKEEQPKEVTPAQAKALWTLFNALEPDDWQAMITSLKPEKQVLFFRVMDAFVGGGA